MATVEELLIEWHKAIEEIELRATSRLVAAYRRLYRSFQSDADALAATVRAYRAEGKVVTPAMLYRLTEYKRLMQNVSRELERYGVIVEDATMQAIAEAVPKGAELARGFAGGMLPPSVQASIMGTFNRFPREAIENMVAALQENSPLQRITLSRFGEKTAKEVGDALVRGLASGVGPRKIASTMRTALGIPLSDGLRIARTETGRAFNRAAMAGYRANPHVVKGWRWSADLSPRTCLACIALHGQLFPLEEEFNDHPNGRCAPIPETISMAELGLDIPETRPAMQSGGEWFKSQPESVQRQMMGPGKYEAWSTGKVTLDQFVHTDESPDWGKTIREASLESMVA